MKCPTCKTDMGEDYGLGIATYEISDDEEGNFDAMIFECPKCHTQVWTPRCCGCEDYIEGECIQDVCPRPWYPDPEPLKD